MPPKLIGGGSYRRDACLRRKRACEKLVEKYGVFDIKGSTVGLGENICDERFPCPDLVLLYARMGLHRYNLLQGTKFQLSRVEKYILSKPPGVVIGSYYITLDAMDPANGSSSQIFQTEVSEEACGRLILLCNLARIRGDKSNGRGVTRINGSLPEWPAENPFEKYNLVEESDDDWIRLYMELAVATKDRSREAKDYGPSTLEIVKVAMDANGEGLNALNATFYVRYKDLYEAQSGKVLDRFAIVRRRLHEDTGSFSLVGSLVTPNPEDFQM
ncbi:unnamed protein product [Thlaspi arvense]|uniref:Uncharacterized protein n=1 Tax=Thlaspi arvense TaxID=13288 RepID=A0AAU9SNP3_THLAR|nr:unnamed protein product [Thlaspi arvense]